MKKKKGFTLVELLVVIAILAILATVSIFGYSHFLQKARNTDALYELTQLYDYLFATTIDGTNVVLQADDPNTTEIDETAMFYFNASTGKVDYKDDNFNFYKSIINTDKKLLNYLVEKLVVMNNAKLDITISGELQIEGREITFYRYDVGVAHWNLDTGDITTDNN